MAEEQSIHRAVTCRCHVAEKFQIPVCCAPGQKHLHDMNMHNSDTVLDKAGGQGHLCRVLCIVIQRWATPVSAGSGSGSDSRPTS